MAAVGYALQLRHLLTNRRAGAAPVALITLFYSAAAVLMGAGIIFSWSRGSWSAFGVSILVMLLALPRKFWHGAALVGVVGALVGLLWLSGRLPASVVERINSATQETFSFTDVRGVDITPENYAVVERFAHWQAAINMATAHPWLGVGFGNYEVSYNTYNLMNWQLALGHAHNFYLNVFAETGIIGLVAYAALWLVIILLTWRVKQHPDPLSRLIGVGLLGTWTYLSIHSLTDNLYVNNVFIHIGVMLGLLSVLSMRGLHVSIRSNG
jgi:putative inorganic carbon (hco3(-)) transporter